MKLLLIIALLVFSTGCGSTSDSGEGGGLEVKSLTISVSGLIGSVTLLDSVSNTTYEITNNGDFTLKLMAGQSIYQLDIIDSQQQNCTLNEEFKLECNVDVCTADYSPVCAKEPLAGVVCVTTPCDTAKYQTFSNACHARAANAWIAFESECLGLEEVVSEHIEPVFIADLSVLDIDSDSYTILSTLIEADTLTIELQVSGGCGSHNFDLLLNNTFEESMPIQVSHILTHQNNDNCDALINLQKTFDLEPLKEIYRRAYPNSSGEQTVNLADLGSYNFEL